MFFFSSFFQHNFLLNNSIKNSDYSDNSNNNYDTQFRNWQNGLFSINNGNGHGQQVWPSYPNIGPNFRNSNDDDEIIETVEQPTKDREPLGKHILKRKKHLKIR